MDNPEKKATQNEEKKPQYALDTSMRKQAHITQYRHEPSYKQLVVTTNRTSFLCGNCNGQHSAELSTERDIMTQQKPQKVTM